MAPANSLSVASVGKFIQTTIESATHYKLSMRAFKDIYHVSGDMSEWTLYQFSCGLCVQLPPVHDPRFWFYGFIISYSDNVVPMAME